MKKPQALLKELSLFSELTNFECDHIASLCRLVEGNAGDRLIAEGEQVRTLYFLVSGELSVTKGHGAGQNVLIATVGKGAVLGEMALLERLPASATVEATGPFQALAIELNVFTRLIENSPLLGYKIFKKMAQITSYRLRIASGQLAEYKSVAQSPTPESTG